MKILNAEFAGAVHAPGRTPPCTLPEIAFAGRSNVGKSSLLNALLHRKGLARISHTPGRTQAIHFYRVNGRFFFVDLPGYGYARAPEAVRRAWRPLVEGYLEGRASLRAVVVILDIRRDPTAGDVELLAYLAHHGIPALVILSKADKLPRGAGRPAPQRLPVHCPAAPPSPGSTPSSFPPSRTSGRRPSGARSASAWRSDRAARAIGTRPVIAARSRPSIYTCLRRTTRRRRRARGRRRGRRGRLTPLREGAVKKKMRKN